MCIAARCLTFTLAQVTTWSPPPPSRPISSKPFRVASYPPKEDSPMLKPLSSTVPSHGEASSYIGTLFSTPKYTPEMSGNITLPDLDCSSRHSTMCGVVHLRLITDLLSSCFIHCALSLKNENDRNIRTGYTMRSECTFEIQDPLNGRFKLGKISKWEAAL